MNDQTNNNDRIGTKHGVSRMQNWIIGGALMVLAVAVGVVLVWRGVVSFGNMGSADDPVVIEMKPENALRSDASDYYASLLSEYESGGYDITDPATLTEIKTETLTILAQRRIADLKIAEQKLDTLADADRLKAQQDAQAEFDGAVEMYAPFFQNEEGTLTEDELRAEVLKYFEEQQITLETVTQYYLSEIPTQRLLENIYKNITVTDEEVEAAFQLRVDEQKLLYENDINNYEVEREYYGTEMVYTPPGYRGVRHILLAPTGELQSRLDTLDSELYTLRGELIEIQQYTDSAPSTNSNTTHVDDVATPPPGYDQAALEAKSAEITAKTAELEEARKEILPSLEPVIKEIQEKLAAGETFASLIEEYGSDPGMTEEPARTEGYPVHAQSILYDDAFQQGAAALGKVGDVSEPILSSFGVHIIEYTSDIPEGAAEMTEALKETFRDEALIEKQNAAIDAQFDLWMKEYEVVLHPDRLE